jgi:hypothetical protein
MSGQLFKHNRFAVLKKAIISLFVLVALRTEAQIPDHIYKDNIRTVKLYKAGDIYSYPALLLNSGDQLELHFDDMDGDMKYYYYTFQLCNADWRPADIQSFDYIRGFQTNRITTYRNSSIIPTRYTHYQATFPERNSVPTRSGNYLLKVFLNDDTSKLVFTKRFLVINPKTSVSAVITQPFNASFFKTHQRVQIAVNTANAQINSFSPQDLKVTVLQNNVWSTGVLIDRPTIFRGNYFEYSDEDATTFQAGKEWRWLDLRSLRLLSDRMQKIIDTNRYRTDVIVKPDAERRDQVYVYYRDYDGIYTVENIDNTNPYWQSDYAWVHFTFVPPGNRAYEGKSVYLFGELTNFQPDESSKMIFNEEKGIYEKELYLKQGYYNYSYVTMTDRRDIASVSLENTEGNYWGTENNYMVLVYYRPFGARADELIGYTRVNSAVIR